MARIHPWSIVEKGAEIADDVVIGPFCVVGPGVKIGAGTELMSHVTVLGRTEIGERNRIFAGASVGCEPQDKKYAGEDTRLVVGDDNVIRENCTLSTGTVQDQGLTKIGSRNLFMANVHIAHDCVVGDDTILANNCGIAGHAEIGDFVVIGGQTGVHQFVRIGCHSMIGGLSPLVQDVPPYVICNGSPVAPHGLNMVGLRRRGFSAGLIGRLKDCYRLLYREGNLVADALAQMDEIIAAAPEEERPRIAVFRDFVASSRRGIIR